MVESTAHRDLEIYYARLLRKQSTHAIAAISPAIGGGYLNYVLSSLQAHGVVQRFAGTCTALSRCNGLQSKAAVLAISAISGSD